MAISSPLESSLWEAMPHCLGDLHLCVSGLLFVGRGIGSERWKISLSAFLQAKILGSCQEQANLRLLWKFEHFLATYLLDLS